MSGPFQRILTGILFFLIICVIATAGYVLAGWNLMDALYMVIITIFGVGYGEVQPIQSPALRALTISTIIAGYAAVIYTVGGFVQMLIDGELNKALGVRRMSKEIERLENHTVICGVGRMGTILAREMKTAGKPFVVIDGDPRRLQHAEDQGYLVVAGDATEEYILEQAGIRRAAVLASVLSEDATNVFVTVTAREMNPKLMIISRGENPRTEKKLISCGADKVVLPTAIGAAKVAQLIIRPTAESILDQLSHRSNLTEELGQIGLKFNELEVPAGSNLIGKALHELEVRNNHGFLIVAVRRAEGDVLMSPPPSTKLSAGDKLIVIANQQDALQLAERFATKSQIIYRGVKLNS